MAYGIHPSLIRDFRRTHIWTWEVHPHKISKHLKRTSSCHVGNTLNKQEWLRWFPQTCRRLCGILLPTAVGTEGRRRGGLWSLVGGCQSPRGDLMPCLYLLTGTSELLPASQLWARVQNLSLLSAKHHCLARIQCSMHSLPPRRAHEVTDLPPQAVGQAMAVTSPNHGWDLPWHFCTCSLPFLETGVKERHNFSNQVLILLTKMIGFLFDKDPPLQLSLQLPNRRLQAGGDQSFFPRNKWHDKINWFQVASGRV